MVIDGLMLMLGKNMELLYLVGTIWSILLVTFAMCLDTRRPMSTKLKYKYRVKDDSIFRKIIKFKQKIYTQWDQTDQLKQMKDADILAEKKKSNTSLNLGTLKDTVLGAGAGALVGGVMGGLKKGETLKGGAMKGALLAVTATSIASALGNRKQKKENEFYNSRLEYAQRQALRREKKDWKNNMTNRDGYTY